MNRRVAALVALAVLIAALGASPALAQNESPLRFGVKLGVNISDLRGMEGMNWAADLIDWKTGFVGGVFMSYKFNDWFALQPELLYSMKGMKLGFLSESILTVSLDYIEIPILAMADIPLEGTLRPFFYAGPVIGFNVRSNIAVAFEDFDAETDMDEFVSGTEFSLALGLGLNISIAGRDAILDFRYEPGLTNIFTSEVTDNAENSEWKNDTIAILLGIRI
jgi:hypothetical protein